MRLYSLIYMNVSRRTGGLETIRKAGIRQPRS